MQSIDSDSVGDMIGSRRQEEHRGGGRELEWTCGVVVVLMRGRNSGGCGISICVGGGQGWKGEKICTGIHVFTSHVAAYLPTLCSL